jgi:hypothetical protein
MYSWWQREGNIHSNMPAPCQESTPEYGYRYLLFNPFHYISNHHTRNIFSIFFTLLLPVPAPSPDTWMSEGRACRWWGCCSRPRYTLGPHPWGRTAGRAEQRWAWPAPDLAPSASARRSSSWTCGPACSPLAWIPLLPPPETRLFLNNCISVADLDPQQSSWKWFRIRPLWLIRLFN